jgi:hypothetical protein
MGRYIYLRKTITSFVIGLVVLNSFIAAGINTHIIKTNEISSGEIEPCGYSYIPLIASFRLAVNFGGDIGLEFDCGCIDEIKNWTGPVETVKICFSVTNRYNYSGAKTVYWRIGEWPQPLGLPGQVLPLIMFFFTQGHLRTLPPFNKDNRPMGFNKYKIEYDPHTNESWCEYIDIEFSLEKDYYDLTVCFWGGPGLWSHFGWCSYEVNF